MTSTMSSSSSEPALRGDRDRKRSAHWSDEDTDVLVNVLLRHRETGRTADNGFKPEVWAEAAGLLEGTTYMGGPKTADACKSRWQRLQRDYKAVKDMEQMPGFTWDRSTHRLSASQEAWEEAKKVDSYKHRKIHLPCFDSLALLCVLDSTRGRIRTKDKSRTSLASVSDTSSILNLSVGSGGPGPQAMSTSNGHGHGHGHGHGQHPHSISSVSDLAQPHAHQHSHSISGPSHEMQHHDPHIHHGAGSSTSMTHLQGQTSGDQGMFHWGETGEEDGEGEFDGPFTLDGAQPFGLGKRQIPFDPSLLAGPSQPHALPLPQGSPPKKPRISNTSTNGSSFRPQPPPLPHQNGHSHSHSHSHSQSHMHVQPFAFQLAPSAPSHGQHGQPGPDPAAHPPSGNLHSNGNGAMGIPRSPDFGGSTTSTTNTLLDPNVLQTPPPGMMKPFTPSSTPGGGSAGAGLSGGGGLPPSHPNHAHHSHHPQHTHFLPPHHLAMTSHSAFPPSAVPPSAPALNGPGLPSSSRSGPNATVSPSAPHGGLSAELAAAGLTDAQRRTEAILQLQKQETEMPDEDMVEVMAEFEGNVAAADTYLAIKREGLRRLWITKLVKRRKGA